jgi:hypothetical protein
MEVDEESGEYNEPWSRRIGNVRIGYFDLVDPEETNHDKQLQNNRVDVFFARVGRQGGFRG